MTTYTTPKYYQTRNGCATLNPSEAPLYEEGTGPRDYRQKQNKRHTRLLGDLILGHA